MSRRSTITAIVICLAALSIALGAIAIWHYPAYFVQRGAMVFLVEPASMLLVYMVATLLLARKQGSRWDTIWRCGIAFGSLTGALELVNLGVETWGHAGAYAGVVSVGFMVAAFVLWAAAGAVAARTTGSIAAGVFSALIAAGMCMLIAVPAGFVVEFFVAPPNPAVVSIWAEFRRSGWHDARAFAIANTLDSGFTHLLIAPIVASIFGLAASFLARLGSKPRADFGTK